PSPYTTLFRSPANSIHKFDVNLRPIKSGFARHGFVFNIQALQDGFERTSRMVPLLFTTDEILAVNRVPRRKFRLELIEPEILQHVIGKLDTTGNFVLNLFRRAKDVRVVLSEAAYAQQPVHYAGTLIPIYRA